MIHKWFNQKKRKENGAPTAVAVHYDEGKDEGPQVIAQGKGYIAEKIIEMAREKSIPLQEDSMLVSNLIDMDLGDNIPPQLYLVIAEILLMIEEMEDYL